jgi:peptide/nickel transport system permease protein
MSGVLRYIRRNPSLGWGLGILLALMLFATLGRLFIDERNAYALATIPDQPPSWEHPFGTDTQGKDLFSGMVIGMGMTLTIGAIAGLIGIGIGTVLGFITGYYAGSILDSIITAVVDIVLTLPGFFLLVLVASTLTDPAKLDVVPMGVIASITAWANPTRAIRAQVMTMRERPFVMMAKLSATSNTKIILRELMPNLSPYLAMSLAGAVYGGLMGSLSLEALGIGNRRNPTLGMTIFWVNYYSAFMRGMWWWILAPVAAIILVLTSLVLISMGLDEVANPRVRRRV